MRTISQISRFWVWENKKTYHLLHVFINFMKIPCKRDEELPQNHEREDREIEKKEEGDFITYSNTLLSRYKYSWKKKRNYNTLMEILTNCKKHKKKAESKRYQKMGGKTQPHFDNFKWEYPKTKEK